MGWGLPEAGWARFRISVLPWKPLSGPGWVGRSRVKAMWLCLVLLILCLPVGVPAQESAPSKLIVYLQRFRPQDYQRLLKANSSGDKPPGTTDPDSSLG